MDASTFEPGPRTFEDLVTICRSFVPAYLAFLRLNECARWDVGELISALSEDDMETAERERFLGTLAHVLFPNFCQSVESLDSREFRNASGLEAELAIRELDQKEETFAGRLQAMMDARGLVQSTLASAIGVRQSAVSMMLSRKCRPQRRTIAKVAAALGVPPHVLWPG